MGQDIAMGTDAQSAAAGGTSLLGAHAERLSTLVTSQRASVDRDTGLALYRDMTLGRRFEDKCAEMYYRGKMFGFVHLYNGQEAVSTGVIGDGTSTRLVLQHLPRPRARPQRWCARP